MTITVTEAQALIAMPKAAILPMTWQVKIGGYNPSRFMFDSALRIDDEVREDLFLRFRFRGEYQQMKGGVAVIRSANIASGLYAANNRIFAYDYDAGRPHVNQVGEGRPYYRQSIIGLHQHIWTEQGYGYAEPLTLTNHDVETIIHAFVSAVNTTIPGGIARPPAEQLSFPL
jgi:hypothetical protein